MDRRFWMDGLFWFVSYSLLWYLLAGGAGLAFALPAVLAATSLALALRLHPWYLRPMQVFPFLVFFLSSMVSGAWDVAKRALHPLRPIKPGWVEHPLQTSNPRIHLLLSALVGLLPGTLVHSIDKKAVDDNRLRLHVLDMDQPVHSTLSRLEDHLERLLITRRLEK